MTTSRCSFITVVILLSTLPVLAQDATQAAKPPEPDRQDVIYLLDSSAQALTPLPQEPAKPASKVETHFGTYSVKVAIQIPGTASSTRVKGGHDLEFIVKCTTFPIYQLLTFAKQGNNREGVITAGKGKAFGGASDPKMNFLTFDVSKYGESSYRLVMKAPQPGEYGFVVGNSVFDFAVDPQ